VDARLRAAVDASLGWYDDVFALHRIPTRTEQGLWSALGPPPPWHSAAKTLEPGIDSGRVVRAVAGLPLSSVADSFGDLGLAEHGFDLLFDAAWLHRPPTDAPAGSLPEGWSLVRTATALAEWSAAHDYTGVLLPGVLGNSRLHVLARHRDGTLTGGAVTHRGPAAVDLSNVWGVDGDAGLYDEVLAAVSALHPGRAVTGYATGEELAAMLARGFDALGPQRVWLR
jgi:hypothetical protein